MMEPFYFMTYFSDLLLSTASKRNMGTCINSSNAHVSVASVKPVEEGVMSHRGGEARMDASRTVLQGKQNMSATNRRSEAPFQKIELRGTLASLMQSVLSGLVDYFPRIFMQRGVKSRPTHLNQLENPASVLRPYAKKSVRQHRSLRASMRRIFSKTGRSYCLEKPTFRNKTATNPSS